MSASDIPSLRNAFARGRIAVEAHINAMESAGSTWQEESASEILWVNSSPFVRFANFNRQQESQIGSDWLWWWIDANSECFGMLVQAKRYFRTANRWLLKLKGGSDGSQMRRLIASASDLGVSPQYILYRGDQSEAKSVSVLPALEAVQHSWHSDRDAADLAFRTAVPLEFLANSEFAEDSVFDLNSSDISEELRLLLSEPQTGARRVAKEVFRVLADSRTMSFSSDVSTLAPTTEGDPVFSELPLDRGHFVEPYYTNIFRGLRRSPPEYIERLLNEDSVVQEFPSNVGGIVAIAM